MKPIRSAVPLAPNFLQKKQQENLTEAGAAKRFARLHGEDVRYDHCRDRWLFWPRHRWIPDDDEKIVRVGLDFARQWQKEALAIDDLQSRKATFEAAIKLERRQTLGSMLQFARALEPITDNGQLWDANPWLFGVPNGVIDLRTGEFRDGRREDRITMCAGVPFDTTADCPRWKRFLIEIFNGDEELIGFVRRAIGYSLTGVTSEQCLILLYGTGANGKTTLLITLKFVLGDYAWNMPFSTIEMRDRAAIPNDVAALVGRRFVVASETNDGTRLNEARVKALTGSDPITARFLHQEYFTFEPVAKFWLSANQKPVVRDDSHGFWRRIRLIPFTQTFTPDSTLADALKAEAPGILAWAVRACLEWRECGLKPPAVVTDATADYQAESDVLREFICEAIDEKPDSEMQPSELYEIYKEWTRRCGLGERERISMTAFGRKMTGRFKHRMVNGRKRYLNIARRTTW